MDAGKTLANIIEVDEAPNVPAMLDLILPPKIDEAYSLRDIEQVVTQFQDEIELVQRDSNDKFDSILADTVEVKLMILSDEIIKTLSDVTSLQENISRARDQYEFVKNVCCDDKVVQERQQLLISEDTLKRNLQRSKFASIIDFFNHFCAHLEMSLATCRRLSASNSSNYLQYFDWANYHQVIFLLRACGQAICDLEMFEHLYQSCKDMFGLSFRQPINKMDLNNFIEFHSSYSLETQVDIILNSHGDRCELGKYLKEPKVAPVFITDIQSEDCLFKDHIDKMVATTIECCRLLVELNQDYIEAHLTDGINIDKLNGHETTNTTENSSVEVLPSYAFSPQDYITQIGQHLLALKKQTEKFDQFDDGPLLRALSHLRQVRNCVIDIDGGCKSATEVILKCVARQIIRSLVGRTTASVLSQLNANGLKQIATDAIYLDDVLKDLNLLDTSDPFVEKFKSLFSKSSVS